ncbi:hypothetical protein HHI36_013208 [Cryptolaemus montrouzieri]|uniref:Uncharacterized protein n=1 Tax=Cryptolaemus montrouzieri TaxID=559131 RepID=A0ABD2NGM3_9CUCU
MRIIYRVTLLKQEMVDYRQQLHAEFSRMYPDTQISEQSRADQYLVILRNNLIPETRLNNIKQEVKRELERLKGYKTSSSQKRDNAMFEKSEKSFFRRVSDIETVNNKCCPIKQHIGEFWTGELATSAKYNTRARWIDEGSEIF